MSPRSRQLLAGIAERGADWVGFAYRGDDSKVTLHKQRTGASELLDRIEVPQTATQLLVHVQDYTKGHPRVLSNNHPIRHGAVVGIHNGTIVNDDELFAAHGIARAEPSMTVDSELIFALAEQFRGRTPTRSSNWSARWQRPGSTQAGKSCCLPAGWAGRCGSAPDAGALLRVDAPAGLGRGVFVRQAPQARGA